MYRNLILNSTENPSTLYWPCLLWPPRHMLAGSPHQWENCPCVWRQLHLGSHLYHCHPKKNQVWKNKNLVYLFVLLIEVSIQLLVIQKRRQNPTLLYTRCNKYFWGVCPFLPLCRPSTDCSCGVMNHRDLIDMLRIDRSK